MSVKVDWCNIAYYRKLKGYTQSDLADLLLVSKNTIISYECGDFLPTLEHAVNLCVILDVDFCKLFSIVDVKTGYNYAII